MNWEPLTAPIAAVCVVAAALKVEDELCQRVSVLGTAVARTANLHNIVNLKAHIVELNIFSNVSQ